MAQYDKENYTPLLKTKDVVLINGDCLEILGSIDENSIDMVLPIRLIFWLK